jgi:phage baseplate assembly protein W
MGYKIVSPNEVNEVKSNGLGISYVFRDRLFKPIYIDLDQAYENLKNLLLTRIGERILQPTFGTKLFNILFQPNVFELIGEIKKTISEAVSYWLPYINLDVIDVVTNLDDPTLIHNVKITISFSLNEFETKTITLTVSDNAVVEVE